MVVVSNSEYRVGRHGQPGNLKVSFNNSGHWPQYQIEQRVVVSGKMVFESDSINLTTMQLQYDF
jgi:hypothetical protein